MYEPRPMTPESTAADAAGSVLVVTKTLLAVLPWGDPRTAPEIVIVNGTLAGMVAPIGDML